MPLARLTPGFGGSMGVQPRQRMLVGSEAAYKAAVEDSHDEVGFMPLKRLR